MDWKRFPAEFLEELDDEQIEWREPEAEVHTYKRWDGTEHEYVVLTTSQASPIGGHKKIILHRRDPAIKVDKNGYPYEINTEVVYSKAYWLSKEPEILAVGYRLFGYRGGQNVRLYRRDKDGNWTGTNRRSKAVKKALRQLMKVQAGKLDPDKLYAPENES